MTTLLQQLLQKDNLVEQCLKAMTRKFNENPDVSTAQRSTAQRSMHSAAWRSTAQHCADSTLGLA